MTRAWFVVAGLAVGACSPSAIAVTPDHPANADAPVGRLAGPPAALRPGVAQLSEPSEPSEHDATMTNHEHHGSGEASPDVKPTEPTPAVKAPIDPEKPTATPKKPPSAPKPNGAIKKPTASKPEPNKPEPNPHAGHDMGQH